MLKEIGSQSQRYGCSIRDERRLKIFLQGDRLEDLFTDERRYTLILFSFPIDHRILQLVQTYGRNQRVPIVSIHSAGFYSYFRIHLPGSFPIVDTHPDSTATHDLRLLNPWPELSDFAAELTNDIDNLPALEHGHIPYVALLLYYLKEWRRSHGGFPTTYKEKQAFRDIVSAGALVNNPEGGEENFDEAAAAVLKTISTPNLPSSVQEVFDYQPNTVSKWFSHSLVISHYLSLDSRKSQNRAFGS
jgi:amyloid beta precursor protein binding protein 1